LVRRALLETLGSEEILEIPVMLVSLDIKASRELLESKDQRATQDSVGSKVLQDPVDRMDKLVTLDTPVSQVLKVPLVQREIQEVPDCLASQEAVDKLVPQGW
jgi:hypothetical protein